MNIWISTDETGFWLQTLKYDQSPHLQAQPPMSAVAAPSLITCNPSWILQWQMQNSLYTLYYGGVFKGRWVFKGNLVSTSISSLLLIILCLAVTLLTSTKVQLGSKELSFLTKENNTGLAHLNMVWKCWHRLLFKRRPLGLEVHVVELDTDIPSHVAKTFLSESCQELRDWKWSDCKVNSFWRGVHCRRGSIWLLESSCLSASLL